MPTAPTGLTVDAVADTYGLVRVRWTGDADGLYSIFVDGKLARRVIGTFAEVQVGSKDGRRTIEVVGATEDADEATEPDYEIPPTRAILEWHVPNTTTAAKFRVYWDEGAGGGADVLLEEIDYIGQWTASIETPVLTSGVAYEFSIRAVDDAGNESAGTTLTLTLRTLPAQPTGLAIAFDSGTGRASLSWT